MKTIITRIKRLALALCFVTPLVSWAAEMTNPVTGETETYANTFTGGSDGTGTEWNDASNWDTSVKPFIPQGDWNPALVTNKMVSTTTAIDGYTLRVGAYNGATVTWSGGISKIQGGTAGCWLTADETSSIAIASFGGAQLEGSSTYPLKLSSANVGGITWGAGLTNASNTTLPFWYYLKGDGTVVYEGDITVANAQVIKMADVTLSGNEKSVQSKTLVTFGSGTTTTFTADAAIKVYDTDGSTLKKLVGVTAVRRSDATIANTSSVLTTADAVGTCEIVQCTDGIVLYYVDGAPSAVTGYTPSININFTNGNGLTTAGEVGLSGYAVPGMSWNNFTIPNNNTEQTFSTVAAIDSTGAASTASGVSVSVSGHRGVYYCSNLDAGSNPLHGYVDEGGATGSNTATPTVTITGIPYAYYRLIVYHSTDSNNLPFGYDTINETDFTYVDGVQAIGTTSWGNSGATNGANPIDEGVNTLVSGILSGSTATMVAHRVGTATSASVRGCFAAIQVVEVVVSETELVIPVSGATTYTVDANKEYEKVIISGTGTLTLDGTGTITTDVLEIENNSAIVMNSSRLDATTVIGKGTAIYDGAVPPTDKGWTDSAWTGTVWLKNKSGITGNDNADTGVQPNNLGNANSKVKFSGVSGWVEAPITYDPEIVLENDAYDFALKLTNGNSPANKDNNDNRSTTIKKLSGSGTLCCGGSSYAWPLLKVWDSSGFTGSINTSNPDGNTSGKTGLVVVFCAENTEFSDTLYALFKGEGNYPHPHTIYVASGTTVTQGSGATWTSESFGVDGTLVANGTLAASASTAVSGAGTVVFTGRAPTPTGDAWWKNAAWTGTVEIKDVADMIGASSGFTGTYLDFASYGNAESKIKISNISGWLPNQTFDGELVLAGTLTINNAVSGYVFKVKKLSGNGGIQSNTPNTSATTTFQAEDPSAFAGWLGIGYKRVVFGSSLPEGDFVHGQIYVGEGVVVTNQYNANNAWWATGGIKVDGELCSPNLARFGGGTTITTTDTGVFTLVSNSDTDDMNVDYTRIQGTGTLKFEGSAYRCISTNNFPTAMIVENNLNNGLIHRIPNLEVTIGSLSGSGQMRSDWGGSGSTGDRDLRILQANDTTYSGLFASTKDRIDEVYVAPGESTAGTLTLSGAQTASNGLIVETGASVNLTGTWVGATTVAGTIGGTGTLTGNLTFAEGSTFKVWESDINGLAVSGTITYPENGTVTVDVSDIETTGGDLVILTASDANVTVDANKFALADGTGEGYSLSVNDAGNLVLTAPVAVGAIAPTANPMAYTIYQTTEQVIAALKGLSGSQTLTVTGAFAVDSVTVQSGLDLTVNIMGGSISVGTFNVAGSLILSRDTVSSTSVVLTDAAASCRVHSTLVESVSVTSGVEGKVPSKNEDTSPLYTLVDAPSDTYDVTGSETLDSTGSFTVPAGTTKIKIGTYDVTLGFSIEGTTATLLAPEVVEETNKKAIDVGATTVTLNVTLVPGLYYGVGASEDLTIAKPAMTQYTGENGSDILTVNKPSAEKGFFKVFVDIKE